jgi:photosystem II stability/assembly factor-like uncharacterized protein
MNYWTARKKGLIALLVFFNFSVILLSSLNAQDKASIEAGRRSYQKKAQDSSVVSDFSFSDLSITKDRFAVIGGRHFSSGLIFFFSAGSVETIRISFTHQICQITFVNRMEGWISDLRDVYKTTDGGKTWVRIDELRSRCTGELFFLNSARGWIIGDDVTAYGLKGKSFQKISEVPNKFSDIRKMEFVNELVGWRSERGYEDYNAFLKTTDGGISWENLNVRDSGIVWDFTFVNDQVGYSIADLPGLYFTSNGGVSWNMVEGLGKKLFSKVFFLNETHGWALGEEICRTVDGGKKWKCEKIHYDDFGEDFGFVNAQNGWLITNSKIFATTNGGKTWRKLKPSRLVKAAHDSNESIVN